LPDEEGPAISTTRTRSLSAFDAVRDLGDLLVLQRFGHLDEILDAAFADQLVQPPHAAYAEDLSPVLVLAVDREEHGIVDVLSHVQGIPGRGVTKEESRWAVPEGEHGKKARGGNERAVEQVEKPVAGVDGDCRVIAILEEQERIWLVVLLEEGDCLPVGKGERANGQVPGDELTHLRFDPDEVVAGNRVHAVQVIEVALPERVPDDETAPGKDARRRHREQEA